MVFPRSTKQLRSLVSTADSIGATASPLPPEAHQY